MHAFNEVFIQIILLLSMAIGVTAIAKYFDLPYTIALVIAGLALGMVHIEPLEKVYDFVNTSSVFQVIIISIFLPVILGEATIKMPFRHLNDNRKPILFLAFGGTFLSYIIVGALMYLVLDLPLQVAFVFGALMAATDPISVISIFQTKGVNRKLTTILEGESLFNDGIAVVLFKISSIYLLEYIAMGWAGLGEGILMFLQFAIGGFLIGALAGFVFSHLTRLFDDYPLEIVFSFIMFFGIYFTAEHFQLSGVIAVAVSGIIYGSYGTKVGMTPLTKMSIKNFWDVIALIANSIIFFMVGLQINRISFNFSQDWFLIVGAILIVLVTRCIAVYLSLSFVKVPLKWKHVVNWGGLRGSLSVALALSLPADFIMKDEIIILTFSVVVFSLVVQTLTLDPLIKWLRVVKPSQGVEDYDNAIAHIHRIDKAKEKLEEMRAASFVAGDVYNDLKEQYQNELDAYHEELSRLYDAYPEIEAEQIHDARRQLYYEEHDAVNELINRDIINNKIGDKHKRTIIEKVEEIDSKDE
ncbi:cation:proton antiporter [Tuberibacillus sp. Marseille-P3662]|uniref:cation:proton antiporter n=1 Tax=Tuberibacillus sp. Marseille-P3662 TaxID=1965358 RepID=UPI000A1C80A2|nr:cation:proton antiporter [Tuberibacillus sp. Marseille-P3662]